MEFEEGPPWHPGMFDGAGTDGLPVPARMVAAARVAHTRVGGLYVTKAGPDVALTPEPYTAMLCDGGAFHYFHLMESVAWLWIIQWAFLGGRAPERIVLSIAWDDPRQRGIGRQVMAALYPGIALLDPNAAGWPGQLGQTLIVHRSWRRSTVNKYLEAAMGFGGPHVRLMGEVVRQALGALQVKRRGDAILYVVRPPPRCLHPEEQARLLSLLRGAGACTAIDFSAVPWAQQVRLAAAHDVIVSVHGNGLTNAVWMRPGSLVVELFPLGERVFDYQFIAELCGLAYAGFEGERMFAAGDRGSAYGDEGTRNRMVTKVDVTKIVRTVADFAASGR